jgi:predicted  nucleic acid-binding Zn-ribbon protein
MSWVERMTAALEDLEDARVEYEEAEQRTSYARSEETAARNRLNKAQAEFDALVSDVKEEAPRGSDWRRPR